MNKKITTLAICLMCGAASATTLREAVQKAVTTNPAVESDKSRLDASKHDIRVEERRYYPTVDFNGSTGYEYNRKKFYNRGALSSARDGEANRYASTTRLRASQILFDGFETQNSVERAERASMTANHTLYRTQEGTALDAIQAYSELKARQKILALAEANVKAHEDIIAKVRGREAGGLGTVADTRQAEARLQDALAAKERAVGNAETALAQYVDVVGEKPDFLADAYMPSDALPPSLEEAIKLSLKDNPAVLLAESEVKVSESDYELTEAPFWPTLRGEVSGGTDHDQDGIKGDEGVVSVQLVGEYNLYNGGGDTARRKSQLDNMRAAKYKLGSQRRAAEREVRSAWADLFRAREESKELAKAAQINEQLRKDYYTQFDLGDRSLLDVLDAQIAYFRTSVDATLANVDEDVAVARILAEIGQLNKSLDVGHPPANADSHLSQDIKLENHAPAAGEDHVDDDAVIQEERHDSDATDQNKEQPASE